MTAHMEHIGPTFVDVMNEDVLFPVFFAYRLSERSEAVTGVNWIGSKTLQKVMVTFFGFAGRWVATVVSKSNSRQLLCNDEGVPFIEAYVDKDLDLAVKGSGAFQPVSELQGYGVLDLEMTQFQQNTLPNGLPCIFVQVTRCKCGGAVVAATFHHCHTDGHGFYTVMRAWSSDILRMSHKRDSSQGGPQWGSDRDNVLHKSS